MPTASRLLWLWLAIALPVQAGVPDLQLRGVTVSYSPFTVVAAPGETVTVTRPATGEMEVVRAPERPGHSQGRLVFADGAASDYHLFVTVPASAVVDGVLNGYRIGPEPPVHSRYPQHYQPPAGFIEVSEAMLDLPVSPHFILGQFLCKQASGFPKYLVLDESLPVLLEGLLGEVRAAGFPAATLGIISGYRTPWYNKQIGNVPNSRHVYGDAMDVYVDVDGDGLMDDLDRDGDRDLEDVTLLHEMARDYLARPQNSALVGGVGRYGQTSRHGGFVHVDTRGFPARW